MVSTSTQQKQNGDRAKSFFWIPKLLLAYCACLLPGGQRLQAPVTCSIAFLVWRMIVGRILFAELLFVDFTLEKPAYLAESKVLARVLLLPMFKTSLVDYSITDRAGPSHSISF